MLIRGQRVSQAYNKQGFLSDRGLPKFQRNVMPRSSGSKRRPREQLMSVNFHQTTQRHIPQDTILIKLGRFQLNRTQNSTGSLRRQERTTREVELWTWIRGESDTNDDLHIYLFSCKKDLHHAQYATARHARCSGCSPGDLETGVNGCSS
jgi:hypothetical protein